MSRRIPRNEADFLSAAKKIISGLKANPHTFNNPPIDCKTLEKLAEDIKAAKNEVMQKKAAYQASVTIKKNIFKDFYKDILHTAKYCISASKKNKSVLSKVGLRQGKKKPEPPGQCLNLTIEKQKPKSITLKWKNPKTGGALRSYIIQRQERSKNPEKWKTIWTAMIKQAKIKNQPQGKLFNYRVRASNTLGSGAPSNTVTAQF